MSRDGRDWQFSRNMIVLREGAERLSIINAVLLDEDGLDELEMLGVVANVVVLGAAHGRDEAFYLDRWHGSELWLMPGVTHQSGRRADHELIVGGEMPIADASLFSFETATPAEGLITLERDGGIVISCDSLQNWTEADEFFSADSAEQMAELGFLREANIDPAWVRRARPGASDFRRLSSLEFQHVLPGHGRPLISGADKKFARALAELTG